MSCSVTLLTRDISGCGLFLIIDGSSLLSIGEIVDVQVLGVVDDPPVRRMKIVRMDSNGIGLVLYENSKDVGCN